MNLTIQQQQAIQKGEAVRFTEPETQLACVLVRADVYDRTQGGDGSLDPREFYDAFGAVAGPAGWDDADMDVYEQYRDKP
jgi:hypothetical protein